MVIELNASKLEEWFQVILEIFKREKMIDFLRIKKDKFYVICSKWITFIFPTQADIWFLQACAFSFNFRFLIFMIDFPLL